MKHTKRILAFLLAAITAFSMPFSAYAAYTSKSIFTSSTYTHNSRFRELELKQGIDVSNHNGTVDFAKVKKAGVDFVIIRIGCRGYASAGTLMEDKLYTDYINAAYKQGLPIGVYFYSQALTTAEAEEEAAFVLKRIKKLRSKISLPVYYDYEFAGVSKGRLDKAWNNGSINKSKMTANARAFCSRVENAGFQAGIYASKYFYYDNLDYAALEEDYDIWVAHYATKTNYKGEYSIWQFSSKGTVNGISGNVDSNFRYVPKTFDSAKIPKQAYTGEAVEPDFGVTYLGAPLTRGKDYSVKYYDNIDYGTASVAVEGSFDYKTLKTTTYHFEIVPSAVTLPVLTKRAVTSLTVKWAAHPDADGYRVTYYGANGAVTAGETQALSYKIEELTGGTYYGVSVCAYKTVGGRKYYGMESEILKTVTKPSRVSGLKTSAREAKTLTLKWKKQLAADHYTVYQLNKETGAYDPIGTTTTNSFTVKKLAPNTAYKFKVKATLITEKGKTADGKYSAAYKDYTAPKTPKLKSAVSKSPYRITAKWKTVDGVTGYQVMWSTSSTFTQNKKSVKVKGKTTNKTTVKTARSGGSYYVRVRAYVTRSGKNYYSAWSSSIHLYTK